MVGIEVGNTSELKIKDEESLKFKDESKSNYSEINSSKQTSSDFRLNLLSFVFQCIPNDRCIPSNDCPFVSGNTFQAKNK